MCIQNDCSSGNLHFIDFNCKPLMAITFFRGQILANMFPGWHLLIWIQLSLVKLMFLFRSTPLSLVRMASWIVLPALVGTYMPGFGSESLALSTMGSSLLVFHCFDLEWGLPSSAITKTLSVWWQQRGKALQRRWLLM